MSKSGFRLVSTISLINALARTGALFSIVPLIGRERLLLDASQIGFGLAFGSVVGLLLTYPAGAVVDRYGRKTIIVPTTVLTGISMLLFGIAPTFSWFIVACLVWGGASAASGAAPAAYAADIAPPGMTATAMGMFRMLSDIGYVLGPIMLGWLADAYGMQAPLWTAAGLLIGVGILFALYAPETYRRGVAS